MNIAEKGQRWITTAWKTKRELDEKERVLEATKTENEELKRQLAMSTEQQELVPRDE